MRTVVFEGMDGAGKATQSRLLLTKLECYLDLAPKLMSFPDYDSFMGKLVRTYLTDLGPRDLMNLDACKMDSLVYSLDRQLAFDDFWKTHQGEDVVLDRYYTSNLLYQTLKLSKDDRKAYVNWLIDFEVQRLKLPEPDIIFVLTVDPDASIKNIKERGRVTDHFESLNMQKAVYNNIHNLAELVPKWIIIKCDDEKGVMRPAEEISNEIFRILIEREVFPEINQYLLQPTNRPL